MFRVVTICVLVVCMFSNSGFVHFNPSSISQNTYQTVAANLNPLNFWNSGAGERTDGGYYTLVDENGNVLDYTAWLVYKGDEYIDAGNRHYQVTKVNGDVAYCKQIGVATDVVAQTQGTTLAEMGESETIPVAKGKPVVGIYHTHGDESYAPSQGYSSAPAGQKGGISQVAETLQNKLESLGIATIYNDTIHGPHDSGAYTRSRRTASELMKQGAQVLVDVHRDAVPPETMRTKMDGQNVAQVKLVVGRRNPNTQASLGYAKQIKATIDEQKPGLAKGIFIGKGVYNQDLRPTNILLEVGTNNLTLDEAKAGVTLFAETLPSVLGVSTPNGGGGSAAGQSKEQNQSNQNSLLWILAIVLLGGLGFLLISTGSFSGAINKLKHFGSREWTNLFGRKTTEVLDMKASKNKPRSETDSETDTDNEKKNNGLS